MLPLLNAFVLLLNTSEDLFWRKKKTNITLCWGVNKTSLCHCQEILGGKESQDRKTVHANQLYFTVNTTVKSERIRDKIVQH